jgi:hypothetical protein
MTIDQGGDTGAIIASVFQAFQPLRHTGGDVVLPAVANNADDAAHMLAP